MKNPWLFQSLSIEHNWRNNTFDIILNTTKRDVRGGFDLGGVREEKFVIIGDVNFNSRDKEYWRYVFNTMLNSRRNKLGIIIPTSDINNLIKQVRLERYNYRRPKELSWKDRYGREIANWALSIIEKEVDDPCIDNYRLARKGDKRALKIYRRQIELGCCGYFDAERIGPDFHIYHIGCNYGH